jgi:hypothetical protein
MNRRDTMNITGHTIILDGNELALAIDAYLVAHKVYVSGPRTIRIVVDGDKHIARDVEADIYVDPRGRLIVDGALSLT